MSNSTTANGTMDFSYFCGNHAKVICNLVSFNNAYSKIILNESNYAKITQNKALEFIANALGYNTYKGLLQRYETSPLVTYKGKPRIGLMLCTSQSKYKKAFLKHFGDNNLNPVLSNLYNLLYQYLNLSTTDLITRTDPITYFGLSFMKFGHWNGVAKAYLELNAPKGIDFSSNEAFALLATANALSIITHGVKRIEDLEEIENDSFIANTPKQYKKDVSKALSVLTYQCFVVLSDEQNIYLKRDVEYYTALALNDEQIQPNYIKPISVGQSKNDKEMFKFTNALINYMGQPAIAHEITTETLIEQFHPHIPFEHKTYGQMALQLKLLNGCTTLQDWLCMSVRPSNIQPMVWSHYVVDYYNYMMDEFKTYFMNHVENERYNIKNIYFNDAGLLMYKSDTKFQLNDGNSISANDFCLVANVVNSRSGARFSKGGTFGRYMMFYTYFLFRECKNQNKGVDNETDLWTFSD